MRLLLALLVAFCSSSAFSQPNSVRLFGMGNVSIAVPDSEGEAFVNPAKAVRVSGILLRANPSYLRDTHEQDYSSSGSVSSEKSTQEASINQIGLPVDGIISLNPLFIGGTLSYGPYSSNSSYESDRTYSGSRETSKSTNETSSSSTGFSALGAISLSSMAVGAGVTSSITTAEEHGSYRYSSQYSSSSSESDYKTHASSQSARAGLLIGSPELLEFSFFAVLDLLKRESQPTRIVSNGMPQPMQEPEISSYDGSGNNFVAEIRNRLSESVLMGGRLSRESSSVDRFLKQRYYDGAGPQSIYEKRKTGNDEIVVYQIGGGVSWHPSDGALFSGEVVILLSNQKEKNLYTSSGTNAVGRPYGRGDVSSEYEYKTTLQVVRIGAEIFIVPELTMRVGMESSWGTSEQTQKDNFSQSNQKWTGIDGATLYGSGGFSYRFPLFRVDYSLSFVPTLSYISYPYYYSSSIVYLPSFQQDLVIQHRLTGAIQL